jgi:hypothetical protein
VRPEGRQHQKTHAGPEEAAVDRCEELQDERQDAPAKRRIVVALRADLPRDARPQSEDERCDEQQPGDQAAKGDIIERDQKPGPDQRSERTRHR